MGTRWSDLARLGIHDQPRLESTDGRRVSFADGHVTDFAAVVWATGFRGDYSSWVDMPGADVNNAVPNERGITAVQGLSVQGLPWLPSLSWPKCPPKASLPPSGVGRQRLWDEVDSISMRPLPKLYVRTSAS